MSVIYEKHYPHPSFEEEMRELEESQKDLKNPSVYKPDPTPSLEELYRNMINNRTLILLPEKMKWTTEFIKLAIETSKAFELDTKISNENSHITVSYSFNIAGDMDFLIPILRKADSISFFTGIDGFDITISLDYYTHAVYNKGRLLHPQY